MARKPQWPCQSGFHLNLRRLPTAVGLRSSLFRCISASRTHSSLWCLSHPPPPPTFPSNFLLPVSLLADFVSCGIPRQAIGLWVSAPPQLPSPVSFSPSEGWLHRAHCALVGEFQIHCPLALFLLRSFNLCSFPALFTCPR